MYRDSSIASLLDPSRKLKAVFGCLGWHDQDRSFAVSFNRTYCSARYSQCWSYLPWVVGGGFGEFHGVVEGLQCRVSDFLHRVVVHRRGEAVRDWRSWLREDPLVHPCQW